MNEIRSFVCSVNIFFALCFSPGPFTGQAAAAPAHLRGKGSFVSETGPGMSFAISKTVALFLNVFLRGAFHQLAQWVTAALSNRPPTSMSFFQQLDGFVSYFCYSGSTLPASVPCSSPGLPPPRAPRFLAPGFWLPASCSLLPSDSLLASSFLLLCFCCDRTMRTYLAQKDSLL